MVSEDNPISHYSEAMIAHSALDDRKTSKFRKICFPSPRKLVDPGTQLDVTSVSDFMSQGNCRKTARHFQK